MSEIDIVGALRESIAAAQERQRRRDIEPCPKCGGDKLRRNFTAPHPCHTPRRTTDV